MEFKGVFIFVAVCAAFCNAVPSPQVQFDAENTTFSRPSFFDFGSQINQLFRIINATMNNLNIFRNPSWINQDPLSTDDGSNNNGAPGLFPSIFGPTFSLFPSFNFSSLPLGNSSYENGTIDGQAYEINRTSGSGTFGDGGFYYHQTHIFKTSPNEEDVYPNDGNVGDVYPYDYNAGDLNPNEGDRSDVPIPDDSQNEVYENFNDNTPVVRRQKRWTFDDFVESLLRVKYGLFIKPKNITESNSTSSSSTSTGAPVFTVTIPTVGEVLSNGIDDFPSGDLYLRPSGDTRDLSGDTRVNYVMGHHRDASSLNSDAEVFDWRLLKKDERLNSRPIGLSSSRPFGLSSSEPTGLRSLRPVSSSLSGPIGLSSSRPASLSSLRSAGLRSSRPVGLRSSSFVDLPEERTSLSNDLEFGGNSFLESSSYSSNRPDGSRLINKWSYVMPSVRRYPITAEDVETL